MSSPFKAFRKHQKVVLAALTLMAILAFGVGDVIIKMTGTGGQPTGDVVVETTAGRLTQFDLQNLRTRRRIANSFMFSAIMQTNQELARNAELLSQNPQFAQFLPSLAQQVSAAQMHFGGYSPRDLVFNYLHRHEAKRLGILIDDKQIEAHIDQVTNRKLSSDQFKNITRSVQVSAKELFDIIREELAGFTAFSMAVPSTPQTPEQIWKLYQRVNTREKIEVAPLPVKDFVDKVEAPSDKEIADFFEKHKNDFEMAGGGEHRPGFRQSQKVRLQYLKLPFEIAEQLALKAKPVTDAEIEEYYEKNKETDQSLQVRELPTTNESDPISPEFAPTPGTDPTGPKLIPDDKPSEKKSEEPPAGAAKDKTETPKDKQEEPCAVQDDEKPADKAKPAAADEKPAAASSQEKGSTADEKSPTAKTGEAPSKDAADKPATETKPDSEADQKPAKPKFRPLDDDLRGIIRTRLENERTNQELKDRSARAVDAMGELGRQYADEFSGLVNLKPEQTAALAAKAKTALNELAKKLEMQYGETPLSSPRDLSEQPGIGRSREVSLGEDAMRGNPTPITMSVFGTEQRLCRPYQSEDSITRDRFAYWKIEDVPAHVPKLTDPGVKDQVIAALKTIKARELAKARAEQLAQQASKANKPLEEVFGAETVTGDPKGLALTVRESPEFSWMRESSAPSPGNMFGSSTPPTLGNPIVVTNAGFDFMETVFDKIDKGETGVAFSDDLSVYYVVRVVDRRPADREQFKEAPLFFASAYQQLAQAEEQRLRSEYGRAIEKKYGVKWKETEGGDAAAADDFEG